MLVILPYPRSENFIKTSTGKIQPAATLPVTLVMLEAIRDYYFKTGIQVIKPAGGISSSKLALHYLVSEGSTGRSVVKQPVAQFWRQQSS